MNVNAGNTNIDSSRTMMFDINAKNVTSNELWIINAKLQQQIVEPNKWYPSNIVKTYKTNMEEID